MAHKIGKGAKSVYIRDTRSFSSVADRVWSLKYILPDRRHIREVVSIYYLLLPFLLLSSILIIIILITLYNTDYKSDYNTDYLLFIRNYSRYTI